MADLLEQVHATAIAVAGRAAIIRGPSGSGKSDLALRCLATAPSVLVPDVALLVADDQVQVARRGDALIASAPASLHGRIEVRGLGILVLGSVEREARVAIIVDLCGPNEEDRLPDPWPLAALAGVELPLLRLWPFAASAPLKVLTALTQPTLPLVG